MIGIGIVGKNGKASYRRVQVHAGPVFPDELKLIAYCATIDSSFSVFKATNIYNLYQ